MQALSSQRCWASNRHCKDVLDYSRMAVPHLERHNLHAIIDEVLNSYEEVCKEHDITIKTTFSDSPDIMLDKEQTNQAIGNLIPNAVEAMPQGGDCSYPRP